VVWFWGCRKKKEERGEEREGGKMAECRMPIADCRVRVRVRVRVCAAYRGRAGQGKGRGRAKLQT